MEQEHVEIDHEMLDRARSPRGGWNRAQLAVLGVRWPPPSGWKRSQTGRKVNRDVIERFVALRSADRVGGRPG